VRVKVRLKARLSGFWRFRDKPIDEFRRSRGLRCGEDVVADKAYIL